MKKHRFSTAQQFAIWHKHGHCCSYCREPLRFREITIDHVVPEKLLQNPDEFARVRETLGLPLSFSINDYGNWLPLHDRCNKRKGSDSFRLTLLTQQLLDNLQAKAESVRQMVARLNSDRKKDTLLAKLAVALESSQVTRGEILEVLKEPQFESDADLKALKDSLVQELQNARDDLAEYRCPTCTAALITRGGRALSSDCEVSYEEFECGYAAEDGQMERPCPHDPLFPTFEDYSLEFTKPPGSTTWTCIPRPKTEMARKLPLWSSSGDTKQQAAERVLEVYARYAKKHASAESKLRTRRTDG